MKLDPDELVSVEEIAPQSEDGTVVVTQRAQTRSQYQLMVLRMLRLPLSKDSVQALHSVLGFVREAEPRVLEETFPLCTGHIRSTL